MAEYYRNDYVKLTFKDPVKHHVYVVASDNPALFDQHDDTCWIVAIHDNDWDQVGTHRSTHYVDKHEPQVLYRNYGS